ncbi:hypothetical protein D3C81_829790 [compost metagenome]
MGIDALEPFSHVLAPAQLVPERLIARRIGLGRFAEDAVMLATDLLQAVADRCQKPFVGGQDGAVEVEFDHCGGAHQRLDQAFMLTRCFDGAGKVAGVQAEILDAPFAVLDRLQDGAQPGFLTIAAQQAEGPVKMLATADRGFHALIEVERLHMGRDNVLELAPKQLVGTVEHLALEVTVDHLDPSLGVELEHQHLAVQAALDLLDGHQVFTQLLDFLLELVVEHYRSPGAQHVIECIFIGCRYSLLECPPRKYS